MVGARPLGGSGGAPMDLAFCRGVKPSFCDAAFIVVDGARVDERRVLPVRLLGFCLEKWRLILESEC